MLMILSYGWCVPKHSKYQVGIKWIMNEKLIWTSNSIWCFLKCFEKFWTSSHEFVEIIEVLSVQEFMRAQPICSIVCHIWHAVWLILLLVVSDLSTFVLVNIKYLKSRVSVNNPCTLSNNNPGFSLWGLTINSLTRIDEHISDIFWAAGIFLCLDQLLPDSHHCLGSLDLK